MVTAHPLIEKNEQGFCALNLRQLHKGIQSVNNIVNNEGTHNPITALSANNRVLQIKPMCTTGGLLIAEAHQAFNAQEGTE